MGLLLAPPRGLGSANNFSATPGAASNRGTTTAAAGSANTKGSWVQVIASTAYPVVGFSLQITNNTSSTNVRRSFFDVGIGAAASEAVIVENYSCAGPQNVANQPGAVELFFPIRIPSGTRISVRHASSTASQTSQVQITVFYGNWHEHQTFAGAELIGADTSTTSMLVLTAGNTGTESAWTSCGSVEAARKAVEVVRQEVAPKVAAAPAPVRQAFLAPALLPDAEDYAAALERQVELVKAARVMADRAYRAAATRYIAAMEAEAQRLREFEEEMEEEEHIMSLLLDD